MRVTFSKAMHEISIMESTLQLAEQQARQSGATVIHGLRLRIGLLSGVVADSLRFAFDALKVRTMASTATLEIEEVVPVCRCGKCSKEFEVKNQDYTCPHCHVPSTDLLRGREMNLVSLEVS